MTISLRQQVSRLRAFLRRGPFEQDLEAELDVHLQLAVDENVQRGLSPEEARRQALVRFGGREQSKEQHRDARALPALDTWLQDVRYAARRLRRDRSFSIVAVSILALGIGANVTVFSVVNTILLRPLPLQDPQRLTWLAANKGHGDLSGTTFTVAAYEELQRHNRSFQDVTSYQAFF